jgi:2'-5' RNA ligase
MRLFFALWPDDAVRERLAAVAATLPDRCGRRVRPENLHLTLCFLGQVGEAHEDCLLQGAAAIRLPAFRLSLSRLGWFRRAGVVWLAPEETPGDLTDLVGQIRAVVRDCGLAADTRPYQTHLTLTRKARRPAGQVDPGPIHWDIDEFCLVESVTRAGGAEYRVRQRWALTPK